MSDHGLPLDWVDPELCGPIETTDLDISQPEPGVIEGSAVLYRRTDTGDEFELLIDGEPEGTATVEPSPITRTAAESWRAITREEVAISAEPGIGTFTVEFGGESRELTLLKDLPAAFETYHDNPNDDGIAGLDARDRPTIRIGSNTDMFTTVNTFDSIYVDDGFENRKRVTAKVLPMDDYPGIDPANGYDFARQGIIVRNAIPNDNRNSGFVHLFHSPTLGEVRLQADFTGDGFTAYNDPDDGIFTASPIAADPPLWLRLERRGGTFRSYVSTADTESPPPDSEWQLHRVETLPNVDPVQDVGMYGSHNNSAQVTATFDSFERLCPLPDPWSQYHSPGATDGLAGIGPEEELSIVTGANTDLWATVNEFDALYRPDAFEDGSTVRVRVLPVEDYRQGTAGYEFVRAGLMVRNSLPNDGTDSGYLHLFYSPTLGEVRLQADFTGDGFTTYNDPDDGIFATSPVAVEPPCWLRIERDGDTFTTAVNPDGSETMPTSGWQSHREETLPNVGSIQDVGLYASHNNTNRVTARFDGFAVNGGDGT
jgi:regulation of enolase protein 1 (concanavalin A-like superfamily)